MPPFQAQGAAMAIEDAAVLARALDLPLPLADRLQRYESHRAPRTARVVRESTVAGEAARDALQARIQGAHREYSEARGQLEATRARSQQATLRLLPPALR